jgi:radical SAM superfamily enzyme YgiQ (UPF0313 family)
VKVTFVYQETESLAQEHLSACLKAAGHETELVFDPVVFQDGILPARGLRRLFDARQKTVDAIVASRPDLVAFSVMTDWYAWALDLARAVKERVRVPIAFGGIHASSVPDVVLEEDCVDVCGVGEGEAALVELADRFGEYRRGGARDVHGLWFRDDGEITRNPHRPPEENLDALPFPDKDLFFSKLPGFQRRYHITTSRGCAYRCSYCCHNFYRKLFAGSTPIRLRSPENVIRELSEAKKRWRLEVVRFMDDIFGWDRKWLRAFARDYARHVGLPMKCFVYPSLIDEETSALLAESGCKFVNMGIQTVEDEIRKHVMNRPKGTAAECRRAVSLLQAKGIGVAADHIVGIPEADDFPAAARFYNEVRPNVILVYDLTCYPETEITQYCKEKGYIDDAEIDAIRHGRGRSYLHGGSIVGDLDERHGFRALMSWLPLLPKSTVERIVERRSYRKLPRRGFAFSHLLPRLAASPFNNEWLWDREELRMYAQRIAYALRRVPRAELAARQDVPARREPAPASA